VAEGFGNQPANRSRGQSTSMKKKKDVLSQYKEFDEEGNEQT